MTIEVTQISNSQTFGAWLATTNKIANIISQNTVTTDSTSGGSLTTGNGYVNGYFGANYLYVNTGLVGGNVSSNGEILVLSNTKFQYSAANIVSVTANNTVRALTAVVNTVSFTGNVAFANTLSVNSTASFANAVSIGGNVVITGTANVTANLVVSASGRIIISNGATIEANGGIGSSGHILISNGAGVYWASPTTLPLVDTAANYDWTGFHSHASNVHVGNAAVNTQTSNATIVLANSTSSTTVRLADIRIGNTTTNVIISNTVSSFGGNVHTGNSTVNTQVSNGNITLANSSSTTTVGLADIRIGTTASNVVISNTTSRFSGNVVFAGTANVTGNVVISETGDLVFANGAGIEANGTLGTTGQVLISNGTGVAWASPASLDTVNTYETYTWSNLNTFQANLHTGGPTVNTQISNSVIRLANSTSTTTVQLADIRVGNTTTNVVISNTTSSFGGNVSINGAANVYGIFSSANVQVGSATVNTQISNAVVLLANSTSTTTVQLADIRVGNTVTNVVIANTTSAFGGNVAISGVANVVGNVTVSSAGYFVGNGAFLTTLNATSLSTGTVASGRLPTASVSQAGIVQLIDSTSCTSITLAATANSVKTVYDYAATIAATGTPPSGTNTMVQFNSTNTFGASAGFTYNSASNTVSIGEGGRLNVGNATVNASLTTSILSINGTQVANIGGANNSYYLGGNLPSYYTNATNLNAGTVPTARLATTGTAGSTTFLRGDQAWSSAVTQVSAGNGLSGGPITTTGTLSVFANTGLVANATGLHVNSTYVASLDANNAAYLGSQLPAYYTNATNLNAGTVPTARLATGTPTSSTFLRGDQTWSTAVTSVTGGSGLTGLVSTTGSISVLANTGVIANATGLHVNSAYIVTLDANNATYLNGQAASYYRNADNLNAGTVATGRLASTGTAGSTTFLRGDQSWSTAVTSVTGGSGLTGSVSTTGSISVLANSGIIANNTGVFVNASSISEGTVPTARLATSGTANNTSFLRGDQTWAVVDVTNASNLSTGTLPNARLGANVVNTSADFTITGIHTHSANLHTGNSTVNTQQSNATILISNSTSTTIVQLADIRVGNTTTNVVISNTTSSFGGNMVIVGSANISGLATATANIHTGNSSDNTQISNTVIRIANSTSTTTVQLADIRVGNTSSNVIISNTTSSFSGNVVISGVANVTGNVTVGASAFFVGNGAQLTSLNATNLASGTVAIARLGSGGTPSSSTVLFGNNIWSSVVTSVATGNGVSGGPITGTGTIVAVQGTGTVVNTTGICVNASYIATIAANSATGSLTNSFTVGTASYFVSNGNFGVGTSSPGQTLVVSGTANVTGATTIGGALTTTNTVTIGTAAYHVANGNFGIGNNSPADRLRVEGNTSLNGYVKLFGSNLGDVGEGSEIQLYNSAGSLITGKIDIYSGSSSASANTFRLLQDNLNNGVMQIGQMTGTGSNGTIEFYTGEYYEAMRLKTSYSYVRNSLRIQQDSTDTPGAGNSTTGASIASGTLYSSKASGGVNLELNNNGTGGSVQTFINFRRAGSAPAGNITINAADEISYNQTSDYRLKTNLTPIQNAVAKVVSTPVYNFVWKSSNAASMGFLAHEAQVVAPNAVNGEKDGEQMQSMDYSKMVPLMWAAVQELSAEIASLKAEINALKAR